MATKAEVIRLMGVLAVSFPQYEIPEEASEVYYQILKDIDYPMLEAAVHEILAVNTFYPSVGQWRQTAFNLAEKAQGIPTADMAWAEVWDKITHLWSHEEPEWSHPLIAETVKVVGFDHLCNVNIDDASYERTHFCKVYDSLLGRAREDVRMLPSVREAVNQLTDGAIKQLAEGMKWK